MAAHVHQKYSIVKFFFENPRSVFGCYILIFIRVDRGTDVQSGCKDDSQEISASKIDLHGNKQ
jgi:hypothetical protein